MDFCSEGVQASSGPPRVIHKLTQPFRNLIPALQIARPHQGYKVAAGHLRLPDLQCETFVSNAPVEELVKGSRLYINELRIICPTDRLPVAGTSRRSLEYLPTAERDYWGDDWEGADRSGKEYKL